MIKNTDFLSSNFILVLHTCPSPSQPTELVCSVFETCKNRNLFCSTGHGHEILFDGLSKVAVNLTDARQYRQTQSNRQNDGSCAFGCTVGLILLNQARIRQYHLCFQVYLKLLFVEHYSLLLSLLSS